MRNRHYWTLFVEGDFTTTLRFRASFDGSMVRADPNYTTHERVGEGRHQMWMYSLRGGNDVSLDAFKMLSEQWPSLRFVLVYQMLGHGRTGSGFAIFERGEAVRFAGSIATGRAGPFDGRFGEDVARRYLEHALETSVYDRRLRSIGVQADDDFDDRGNTEDVPDW